MNYIVNLHFDCISGMFYGDRNEPSRVAARARSVDKPGWWAPRIDILKRLVIPSLKRGAVANGIEPWFFFDPLNPKEQGEAIQEVRQAGLQFSVDGVDPLLKKYRGAPLCCIRQDSDDLYTEEAYRIYKGVPYAPGRCAQFIRGYAWDYADRLGTYIARGAPPSFFAQFYPPEAMKDAATFQAFRTAHNLNVPHHKLHHCGDWLELPNWHFIQAVHTANVTGSWTNPHSIGKITKMFTGEEKKKILRRFGL